MSKMTFCAPCLFGLESVLSGEIKRIGGEDVQTVDGRVTFTGDPALLARANICLRTAERVCIVLGTFTAKTFNDLFEKTTQLPFEDYIGKLDAFPVKGWSLRSALHSVPDCQSIIKKAIVQRLEKAYNLSWFEETGPVHQVQFSLYKDELTLMLDTSGAGLHKRGYRPTSSPAPIKETLAAGIADLARVRLSDRVIDPMCGSGTLAIESALQAFNIAPGLRRKFAAEKWGLFPMQIWSDERSQALEAIHRGRDFQAWGFDIDPQALVLTEKNAHNAGVGTKLTVEHRDISDFPTDVEQAVVLCNPPYGERMLEQQDAETLYRTMGRVFQQRPGMSYYIISPHEEFEQLFGRRADKRRKLYNGMIKCQLFMYYSGR